MAQTTTLAASPPPEAATTLPPAEENLAEGRLVLPGGVLDGDGRCHRVVRVRELTGADEERLSDRRYASAAGQVTDFLAHVLVEVEGLGAPVDGERVAGMLVGDRDYLLLRLRQRTFGDGVHQVLRCPSPACGRKADVEFAISEMPVRRAQQVLPSYPFNLSRPAWESDPSSDRGELRLATGRDQEALGELAAVNPARAQTLLLSRVIGSLGRRSELDEEQVRALPMALRGELSARLAGLSPGPDLRIGIGCPHCGADMSYPFDLSAFFFAEWTMSLDTLYREVHHLAYHYHWSEGEILHLPRAKRRRYLALLARELEGEA